MDSKPFFEKKFDSSDPFKKPDHIVPDKFKGVGMPKDRYSPKSLLKKIFKGSPTETRKENNKPEKPKSILEKRKLGLTPYELKDALKKVPQSKVNMNKTQRIAVAEEFEKRYINKKDVEKYLKNLPHKIFLAPHSKDKSDSSVETQLDLKHKEKLLKIVKDQEIK